MSTISLFPYLLFTDKHATQNLKVWKKSVDFVVEIYSITKCFPKEEMYRLAQQMRKVAVSVPSNIAEGCSRKGDVETIQFLYIATASPSELETQLIIANEIGYINEIDPYLSNVNEIKRMLVGLIKSYKTKFG